MSIPTSTLGFFRDQWASRMTDECLIKEPTGETFDTTTGTYTSNYVTRYQGPCLIRPLSESDVDFGQQQTETALYVVTVPYTEIDHRPGFLADLTSATDPYLDGRQFAVKSIRGDTYATRRRILCEEVVSG